MSSVRHRSMSMLMPNRMLQAGPSGSRIFKASTVMQGQAVRDDPQVQAPTFLELGKLSA